MRYWNSFRAVTLVVPTVMRSSPFRNCFDWLQIWSPEEDLKAQTKTWR